MPPIVDLSAFGGSTTAPDNSAAFIAAFEALSREGGGVLRIGPGNWRLAGTALGRGIAVPSNVTVRGAGPSSTTITVEGKQVTHLFIAMDRDNVGFEDLHLRGNSMAEGYTNGEAISFILSRDNMRDRSGFAVRRVKLSNFKAPFWINVDNASARSLRDIDIEDVTAVSEPGNSIAPAKVTYNAAAIGINSLPGEIHDVRLRRVDVAAGEIKSGIIIYNLVHDVEIDDPRIVDAGRHGATDDGGGYAIQLYDHNAALGPVTIRRPVIRNPRSVGIYVAGAQKVLIEDPRISGQYDRRTATLPKGAIVLNGARRVQVRGGLLERNVNDIHVTPGNVEYDADITVDGTRMLGSTTAINLSYFNGASGRGFTFTNFTARTTGTAIRVQNRGTSRLDQVSFSNCDVEAPRGFRALDLWVDENGGSTADGYLVRNCRLKGSNPVYARDMKGSLAFDQVVIETWGEATSTAMTLLGLPRLDLKQVQLVGGGLGLNLAGSAGQACGTSGPAHLLPATRGTVRFRDACPGPAGR